ncbi:MAG: beta-galactosidase [Verrucomicrobiota bacterium]|jgi:hypothetical protein
MVARLHRAGTASAIALAACFWLLAALDSSQAGGGFLQIRNGYFWDAAAANYFIPRGFAYQTLNPPVGASQTFDQLEYDLREFKKMHANSVRAEFVWSTVETAPGVFDWSKPDFLVAKAEELGLRLFVLIGYQYAPSWFSNEWNATNDAGQLSVVLNYEHPQARLAYSNYIYQVASHYKNSPVIGAWILGNEYAYFDLWNTNHSYLGFDPYSLASYHRFLSAKYGTNIAALASAWGTNYASFDAIPMFQQYPPDRNNPGYNDLILWRENSIGQYTAVGAVAASLADPNHLRSYSMVGGLFIGNDANYTCEDAKTIVACCTNAGAPLHFWSINNYAWATFAAELRSTDSGIAKHIANSGLPVLVTETGDSTTDDYLLGAAQRQPEALPSHIWEALMSGAIGAHIFTWNDRDLFNGVFIRERGFGVVQQNRLPKPAYTNVVNMFRRLENLQPERLFPGSYRARPDIALFWPKAAVMGWPRANQENAMLWGALKRVGYQLTIVDDARFAVDAYTNASALLLSRCYQMNPADLERVATNAIPRGIHVHANADLPGQFDAYHHPNPNWASRMTSLFGLSVSHAYPGWDSGVTDTAYDQLFFHGVAALGPLTNGLSDKALTWKIWHGLTADAGTTIVTQTGANGSQAPMPALQLRDLGTAKTAVNTFALGDLQYQDSLPLMHDWDVHYNWLQAIYRNHFGLQPAITLSGTGANYVLADYRYCTNGAVLISLLNEVTNPAVVTLTAPNLLAGKTVENLTSGGIVATNSDGGVTLNLAGDDYVLLYAYASSGGIDQSLLNTSPNKLWLASAPTAVWPTGSNYNLTVGYDLRDPDLTLMASFERVLAPNLVFAQTNAGTFSGAGSVTVALPIPDPDLNNPWYISSHDGGEYVFHAWLLKNGSPVAESYLPVRLLWAVRPLSLPSVVTPGSTYPVTVAWQELPSWLPAEAGSPLDRARLWQPYLASQQYYKVVLQLRSAGSGGQVVASQEFLTNIGTDQHQFTLTVPATAAGPFTWNAYLEIVPNASVDMVDSFEDRDTGADPTYFAPWYLGIYAQNTNVVPQMFFAAGVDTNASDGQQAVFIVITNPPTVGSYSGFYLTNAYSQPWGLPRSPSQWTNYTFSFDFKEASQLNCILELQLKDARGGQIHFTKTNTPGPTGWDTISASLDQFTVPPWVGFFDSETVAQLIVNVQMQETGAMYQASLDNIRFVGLKTPAYGGILQTNSIWDNFDDRNAAGGDAGWAALAPWSFYVYPPPDSRRLDRGIATNQGIAGGQAAFLVVTNPSNVGDISTFGLYRNFTNVWSLPADTNLWTNYVFSYSFRESSGLSNSMEMQVKSSDNNWIEFKKTYAPGPDGWDTVRASLAEFVQPQGVGPFDPTNVRGIALNIRVFQTNVIYVGYFDNVYFDTPAAIPPTGPTFGLYLSSNDSPPPFSIHIQPGPGGQMVLSWLARSDRLYSVDYQDLALNPGGSFLPLAPLTNLTIATNGLLQATDTNAPSSPARFYRVRVQPR